MLSDAAPADATTSGDAATPADATTPGDGDPDRPPPVLALPPRGPSSVFVHLFEWRWTDIAKECEDYLGPAGFTAVQISPPSEHLVLPQAPWWERYQTVGYALDKSRSGTGDELRDMVRRCATAGVAIYVDAVINHMTGQPSGVGSNGTHFTKYSYPGLYAPADFHQPTCAIADADYQNAPDRVRRCELLGLADLDTGADHVRDAIAGYLSALMGAGVHGFRVDAAKHIDPLDLDAILRRVAIAAATKPYYFFEVIDNGGEAIKASDYLATGQGAVEELDVTEFKYGVVADAFLNAGGKKVADLAAVNAGSAGAGLLPSERAVVFVNNHDTQRASSLYYKDGAAFDLATVFMLASPYGYPSVLSSYAFDRATDAGRAIGPPATADGGTRPVWAAGAAAPDCVADPLAATQGWLCEHRRPYVRAMLAFRAAAAGAAVSNSWDDGNNRIAFGRGDKGFVAINRDVTPLARAFVTGLPGGTYCEVYQGSPTAAGCSGSAIAVDATGSATISVPAMNAVVIHVGALAGQTH
ncbi:MAG TPA: alpha-amylase family protein, partial [Polyangia bacterium]|nr:alpha-amylase family protein [Polyangia bacterium]